MFTITQLYLIGRNTTSTYDPEELNPSEFQQKADVNHQLFISLVNDTNDAISLNYGQMISDQPIANKTTWGDVCAALTDELIAGYTEDIPGYSPGKDYPSKVVRYWDVMNTTNTFTINYADHLSEIEGIPAYTWNLLDLSIRLQNTSTTKPNLNKCLPIVNGLACRPYHNIEQTCLYARNGAKLCWQGGTHHTPEILLLDFENFGDISTHSMCTGITTDPEAFTVKFANRNNSFTLDADWLLTNTKYSLYEYTPLIVVAGSIFYPDEYTIINEHTLRINFQTHNLDITLALMKYLTADATSTSEVSFEGMELATYLWSETQAGVESTSTFVLLVKNPNIWVTRIPLDVWMNGITIDAYVKESLLHHLRTNTLRAYHREDYTDHKELTVQNMEELYMSDNSWKKSQLLFVRPECIHHQFANVYSGECEMVYLSTR